MNPIYYHNAPGPGMQEILSAFESVGFRPHIVNLEHPGCMAQIIETGVGPVMFRPHLHLTRMDACIRHMGVLHEWGFPILPSWPAVLSYDDKTVQAMQLKAFGLPHCETRVATDRSQVEAAAAELGFPLVVKLRSGAGSLNVRRLETAGDLRAYARRMFGRGISPVAGPVRDLGVNIRKSGGLWNSLGKAPRVVAKRIRMKVLTPRERGYVLMQRFYPGNDGDVRVTIFGDKAFAFRRMNRTGDFRASGSGQIDYVDPRGYTDEIDLAFRLTDQLRASFLAVDFIRDHHQRPIVVEYCPGFVLGAISGCPGCMDKNGGFSIGSFRAADLLAKLSVAAMNHNDERIQQAMP